MHRVLCQVKLTTLPRNTCERCLTSSLEAFVGIADNQLHTVHAAFLQRREKLTPIHFGFGERHADAQHAAMAAWLDADRDQDRTITDATGDANFLIPSIDDEVFNLIDRAVSPSFEFIVKQLCSPAVLGAGHVEATKLGRDLGDLSGGNALDVHLCDSQFECSFASLPAFQSGRIEIAISSLRDFQCELGPVGNRRSCP